MASNYLPPNVYTPKGNDLKANPKYIALQRVESEITEYSLLRTYLTIILVLVFGRLVWDLIIHKTSDVIIDLIIRSIQIIGYGYGLQAHTSKSCLQWEIFLGYVAVSFGIIAYFAYVTFQTSWLYFGIDMLNFIVNVMLLVICIRFYNCLRKRDNLKKELKEEQPFGGDLKA